MQRIYETKNAFRNRSINAHLLAKGALRKLIVGQTDIHLDIAQLNIGLAGSLGIDDLGCFPDKIVADLLPLDPLGFQKGPLIGEIVDLSKCPIALADIDDLFAVEGMSFQTAFNDITKLSADLFIRQYLVLIFFNGARVHVFKNQVGIFVFIIMMMVTTRLNPADLAED